MKLSTKAWIRSRYVIMKDVFQRTPFASGVCSESDFVYAIDLVQPFMPSPTLESKKHNLREAASRINKIVIYPNEIFSFWHIVGNPNNRKRFKEGRSIHAGCQGIDVGGGLCQASGIIHHLALLAGLSIEERFNHSVDLYTDSTRFTPLGTDATVFYGFKDLRICNNKPFPIYFKLTVEEENMHASLYSKERIEPLTLNYDIQQDDNGNKSVKVLHNGQLVSSSYYEAMTH